MKEYFHTKIAIEIELLEDSISKLKEGMKGGNIYNVARPITEILDSAKFLKGHYESELSEHLETLSSQKHREASVAWEKIHGKKEGVDNTQSS